MRLARAIVRSTRVRSTFNNPASPKAAKTQRFSKYFIGSACIFNWNFRAQLNVHSPYLGRRSHRNMASIWPSSDRFAGGLNFQFNNA